MHQLSALDRLYLTQESPRCAAHLSALLFYSQQTAPGGRVRLRDIMNVFAERARSPLAKDRMPTAEEVIAAAPDIIIGSWCGKHFRPERIAARPGWENIPAVRDGRLHEIKSAVILTPGPVAISEGLPALLDIFDL